MAEAPLSRGPKNGHSSIPMYVWIGAGLPVVGGAYMYYKYLDTVPLTQRRRWIATSPEWERRMGDREYQQLLQQFQGKTLPSDHRASITVQRVGNRIYRATQAFCEEGDLPNVCQSPPTFTVIRSEMANAFVLPNNHIFVMTGLFRYARDEDELAAVLGHEMAHNLARHVGEKISGNVVIQLLAQFTLLVDPSGSLFLLLLPTANLLRELPHSRTQELEADQIGMHLAAKACYDPAASQRVFGRMKDSQNNPEGDAVSRQPPEFLSTHPSHESRIHKMDSWLPEARQILQRDGGVTCQQIREDMAQARRIAAQQAANREAQRPLLQ